MAQNKTYVTSTEPFHKTLIENLLRRSAKDTHDRFIRNAHVGKAFSASGGICRPSELQQTFPFHRLDVGAGCVPRSHFHLVIHFQLHLLVVVVLRREQELLTITGVLQST